MSESHLNDPPKPPVRERSWHYQMVRKFMQRAGQETPDKPCIPSEEVRLLRAKLVLEEALEKIEALGVVVVSYSADVSTCDGLTLDNFEFRTHRLEYSPEEKKYVEVPCEPDLVKIVDGCCDGAVISTGTLIACGVTDVGPQQLVDSSNLAKFSEGGYRREDGKWMKPPNWKAPDLEGELRRQGWEEAVCGVCGGEGKIHIECICYEVINGGHQMGCPYYGLSADERKKAAQEVVPCPECGDGLTKQ